MVTMSAKIVGGGGSIIDSGVADVLAKALFGDPDAMIKDAKARSELRTDQFTRQRLAADTARIQAEEAARVGQNAAIAGSTDQGALLVLDELRKQMQPAANDARTMKERRITSDIGSHMNMVPMDELMPVGVADAMQAHSNDPRSSFRYDEPVPIETPPIRMVPAGPAAALSGEPVGSDLSPQELPTDPRDPAPVVLPENMDTKEEAARLIGAGMYTSDPMGQLGKGAGLAGITYGGGAKDPNNALLYAGKTPADTAAANNELIRNLRKDFAATPAFQEWETINTGYNNMLSAMQSLAELPEGDMRRGPADMRMIYSYLKMLDPNTGVKEGEYSSAREAGGEYASLWNWYDRVVSGAVLDQGTRNAFLLEAYKMQDIAKQKMAPLIKQYEGEARIAEVDPGRIIREMQTHQRPEGEVLPSGITTQMLADVMRDNPELTHQDAIRLLLLRQRGGSGGGL